MKYLLLIVQLVFTIEVFGQIVNVLPLNDKVGIGTISPMVRLHIVSNEDTVSWPVIINNQINSSTISNYGVGLMLKHSPNNELYKWGGIASIQESSWANSSGLALYANEKEYVRIRSDGNVGIGTTNPFGKLELSTNVWTNSLLTLRDTHYSPNQVYHFQIESDGLKIRQAETVNFQFKSGGNFIVNNGNVGIGESNPTKKLVVNGVIGATEVRVSNTPNSDYVFEPDYNLLSLKEVECFIQQNKHLPDIPSAEEFKENGVGIGEMDDMLLKKIEELTLYVIEQEKKMRELEKRNKTQAEQIKVLMNNTTIK